MRCHELTEIYTGIFLSGEYDVQRMLDLGIEVFAVLSEVPEVLEKQGKNIRVIRCRIKDMDVASEAELKELISELLNELRRGRSIGIFCSGGHGRTGYVAACLLSELGIDNPIEYIQKNYCMNAIESGQQYAAVNWYVKHGLRERKEAGHVYQV